MNNKRLYLNELIFIFLMFITYRTLIVEFFSYAGYNNYRNIIYIIPIIFIIFNINFLISNFVKHKGMFFVYKTNSIIFVYPALIYILSNQTNLFYIIIIFLPNIFISLISFFTHSKVKINVNNSFRNISLYKYLILLIVLLIPYILRLNSVNINNLLLMDIYESRISFRGTGGLYLNYFTASISKVFIPVVLILSVDRKNKLGIFISTLSIIIVYLTTGALKSQLLSFVVLFIFLFRENIIDKINFFIVIINLTLIIELLYFLFTKEFLLTSYIRRVFFTSGKLFVQYTDTFINNLTYFSHSRTYEVFTGFRTIDQITLWFGENILGNNGNNASVGYLTELTFSFGYIGSFFAAIIFALFSFIFDLFNIKENYVGLMFIFTETMRNSLLETSLISNGVLITILIIIYFLPIRNGKSKNV